MWIPAPNIGPKVWETTLPASVDLVSGLWFDSLLLVNARYGPFSSALFVLTTFHGLELRISILMVVRIRLFGRLGLPLVLEVSLETRLR